MSPFRLALSFLALVGAAGLARLFLLTPLALIVHVAWGADDGPRA